MNEPVKMIRVALKGKAILSLAAAAAFCGGALYATGKSLSYMFRDVDPDRIESDAETEAEPDNSSI